ncbi:hypothetical protein Val02_10700 [Virgisporangium aliadipatigenens]|uniref:GGDEF domain-containing protein n=1 Tax=Virgisporangium aliadipatigenens TaxID=741659 RepID=A0A8J4DNA2_9ACTN|nr:GGDEF domain-containing protein [Virgisporangium aliadipatigenens]GIJ44184.1 hypothetical protein Val02_10700 [Virgisporangium aliadipatigenens]
MSPDRLPAQIPSFGPWHHLGLRVYALMSRGHATAALRLSEEVERVARFLGDDRAVGQVLQSRMYALVRLERLPDALAVGDAVLELNRRAGLRVAEAKALADTAEILVKLGRLDEGLYRLAAATVLLDAAPAGHPRYGAALSSVCGAAQGAQLYELADDACARALRASPWQANSLTLQRAELLLEWALGLEHVGQAEEAERMFARSVELTERWLAEHSMLADEGGKAADAPLAAANLAVGLAKVGRHAAAEKLAVSLIGSGATDMDSRKAHLAYGLVLRARGDRAAARREFVAAEELADSDWERTTYRYELALLAVDGDEPAERAVLAALRGQARHLWRQRLERRAMMQQARRRVELEAAQAEAQRVAAQDPLTGLGNRRQFDRRIAGLDESYVLVLIDVDRFKEINDGFSHQVGDRVLCEVAATLLAHCRAEDSAVRLGGDEFAMFLRTDLPGAARVAARIREVLAARDWDAFGPGLRVTLSIGLARYARGMDGAALYDRADRQLYTAKRAGRDRVSA